MDWGVNVTCWSDVMQPLHPKVSGRPPSGLGRYICVCMWAEWGEEQRIQWHRIRTPPIVPACSVGGFRTSRTVLSRFHVVTPAFPAH